MENTEKYRIIRAAGDEQLTVIIFSSKATHSRSIRGIPGSQGTADVPELRLRHQQ